MLSFFRRFLTRRPSPRVKQPLLPSHSDIELLRHTRTKRVPTIAQFRRIGKVLSKGERYVFRFSLFVGFVGVVWLGYLLFATSLEPVPTDGGTYTEIIVGSPSLINPLFAPVNDVDADISRLVYSGLMRYDKDQRLVPDLAVKYTMSEDRKTYTFELRHGVRWHDGEPFTARDVVFTFDMMTNPATLSPLLSSFKGVVAESRDDYTVTFKLTEPFAAFPTLLTVGILPEHLLLDVRPDRLNLHRINVQPIGTGPYMVSGFVKDNTGTISRYELARFNEYYRILPHITNINFEFRSGPDAYADAVSELKKQSVDGVHFIPSEYREDLSRRFLTIHRLNSPQYTGIFFNEGAKGPQNELPVRTALIQSLDKTIIAKEAIGSEARVIGSPILPGFPGYGTATQTLVYDRQVASTLLDKDWPPISPEEYRSIRKEKLLAAWNAAYLASLPTSTEGVVTSTENEVSSSTLRAAALVEIEAALDTELKEAQTFYRKNKEGEVLEITLVTVNTHEYEQAAKVIAGMWQDIGVLAHLQFVEPKDIVRTVLKNREYDALLYGVIIGADPDQYPFWHSSQALYPGLNLSGYKSDAMDTLLMQIRAATDDAVRAELYTRFENRLFEDRPAAYLYMPPYVYATNARVKGIDIQGIYQPSDRFANIMDWYIKTKRRWTR